MYFEIKALNPPLEQIDGFRSPVYPVPGPILITLSPSAEHIGGPS